jgi:hypothetical protein
LYARITGRLKKKIERQRDDAEAQHGDASM